MKSAIIISFVFALLLLPLPVFAQYMGDDEDDDEYDNDNQSGYTLEEALELQRLRVELGLDEYEAKLVYEQQKRIEQLESEKIEAQQAKIKQLEAELKFKEIESQQGGGCLIATATYGSELSPQVQQLRELRDNQLLQTESGTAFMGTFNDVYYTFSPIIADYERENPVFKKMVKLAITPMISSLSILNYVDMGSENEVLGYGIGLIILNVGMYFGVPIVAIIGIRKRL